MDSTVAERFPITAIILTHNEEQNIGECLASLDWVDDVVFVDSGSEDGTLAAAKHVRSDVRQFHHEFQDFGDQRNWSLDETSPRHEWILFFDADERSTPEFSRAIQSAVTQPGKNIGFFLCYRNFFLGRWIKRCTYFPTWQLRLLKRGHVRYEKMGHGQRERAEGPLGYIKEPYNHYGFSKGIANWIERHNKYSTEEAEFQLTQRREALRLSQLFSRDALARRRCLKRLGSRVPCRPMARFLYTYILRGGFLDGRAGLTFCRLRLTHEMHIAIKMAERRAARTTHSQDSH